jgi:DNA replication and repair protein RecF
MYLSHLSLSNFRNYQQLDLPLGPGLSMFYGENAQGKTNLLEAVAMLSTSSSFHASSDREVVNWQAPEHIARLEASVQRREDDLDLSLAIFDPNPVAIPAMAAPVKAIEMPANTPRKRIKINGAPKKAIDMFGQLKVVLFAPGDLSLVDGSPEDRRRFLDRSLCQLQARYCQTWQKYRHLITQRSALLKRIRENREDPRMLEYMDEPMVVMASLLIYERTRMIAALNAQVNTLQDSISGGREHLEIVYRPSFHVNPEWGLIEGEQQYRQQLRDNRKKEIQQGMCLLGPHRDDLEFLVNGINMLTYGSRGQQRTTALSAKLAELEYMRSNTGEEPVLLLDDVFSELDSRRRDYLLQQICQHEQVLITATDFTGFPPELLEGAHTYQIVKGSVIKDA